MGEFERQSGFALAGHGGDVDGGALFRKAAAQFRKFVFAADEEWRAAGELVRALRGYGMLSEQERFDLAEAVGMVGAEVEVSFIAEEAGDLAIAIEDAG